MTLAIDRRTLLIGGGVGAGLVVAFLMWPENGGTAGPSGRAFGAYIRIARNGRITVAVPQVETGQGIWTALPQVAADELGAAWELVGVEPAPLTGAFGNSLAKREGWLDGLGTFRRWSPGARMKSRITAGATSVRAFDDTFRQAARTARGMLVAAAARRWGIDPSKCEAADGFVVAGGRVLSFGDLVEEAARLSPAPVGPRRAGRKLFGRSLERLDGPAKVDGRFRLAPDVRLPGLLFASARFAPPGGRIAGIDRAAIAGITGIRHVALTDSWAAIVADDWHTAERALTRAKVRYEGPGFSGSPRSLFDAEHAQASATGGFEVLSEDGTEPRPIPGTAALAATYFIAPSLHRSLEPESATARIVHGKVECWAGTQAPGFAADMGERSLYPMPVGEPAGRAIENRVLPVAIALAEALRAPVQVILPHSASLASAPVSPGAFARCTARIGLGGLPTSIALDWIGADAMASSIARLSGQPAEPKLPRSYDGEAVPYALSHMRLSGRAARLPYRIGYMRGSPQREMAFVVESFIDELARKHGREPLSYRMAILGANARLARCFQTAAAVAEWDGGGAGTTMGLAGASAFGSHIALVASASLSGDGGIRVHRLVAALDAGQIVNPGLASQQVEGALLWGLAQATAPEPRFVGGFVQAHGQVTPKLPGIAETPEIVVKLIPSNERPGGISGIGAVPLAPAIANAIAAGSGRRMRDLPFDSMGVR